MRIHSVTDFLTFLHHNCEKQTWFTKKPWLPCCLTGERNHHSLPAACLTYGDMLFQIQCFKTTLCIVGMRHGRVVRSGMEIEMYLGCLLLYMWVCRWAHQPGGIKHPTPLVSCAMNFTGTLRRPAAQVRQSVEIHEQSIWKNILISLSERRFLYLVEL